MATACLALALAILGMPGAQLAMDPAHALMEPPPEHRPRPYVRPPPGTPLAALTGAGLYRKLVALSRPRSALTILASSIAITCLLSPSTASTLLIHIICFIGSLVEPFDSVMPKRFFLRPFIAQVKSARKAYAIKHGLPLDLDAMEGFVDESVEAAAEAAAASAEAGEGDKDEEDAASHDSGDATPIVET